MFSVALCTMEEDGSGLRFCQPMMGIWRCTHKGKSIRAKETMESRLNTEDMLLETNQPHRERLCMTPLTNAKKLISWREWESAPTPGVGGQRRDDSENTGQWLPWQLQAGKRTRLWGFTAVNAHHTTQNISKELTQKILNVLTTVTPGCSYLVIAMCTNTESPHYLLSIDVHWHVKNILRPGKSACLLCVKPWVQLPAFI